MKTSFWGDRTRYNPDVEQPVRVVENVVFELEKRGMSDVLEVGCGQGRNCIYLAKKGVSVTGVDFLFNDLTMFKEYIKTHALSAGIVQADVSALPFKEGSFDIVLFLHVLSFVKEKARFKAAKEAQRVLRPGGLAVLIERSQIDPLYKKGQQLEKDTFLYQDLIHHFFSLEELHQLVEPMEIAFMKESRKIDTVHGSRHIHGMWYCVAENK